MKMHEILYENQQRQVQVQKFAQQAVAYLKKNPGERKNILRPLVNAYRSKTGVGTKKQGQQQNAPQRNTQQ